MDSAGLRLFYWFCNAYLSLWHQLHQDFTGAEKHQQHNSKVEMSINTFESRSQLKTFGFLCILLFALASDGNIWSILPAIS